MLPEQARDSYPGPAAYPSAEPAIPNQAQATAHERWLRWLMTVALLALFGAAIFADTLTSGVGLIFILQRLQTFVTIFLGIFIEALPFLLAGSLVSGLIAVFVDDSLLARYLPRRAVPAAFAGATLGLLFPVCECGVVPVARRLYAKGLPTSIGIAFLLAGPVVNPVVIASTYAAFGWGPVLWGRLGFSWAVAVVIGLIFHLAQPAEILQATHLPDGLVCAPGSLLEQLPVVHPGRIVQVQQALQEAGDDFLDMARYLVFGSLLAAAMQTLTPQNLLLAIGRGPVLSVLAMQGLAFVLSICSTVDAFLALTFRGVFTTGSIVTFLTFGPMVDIKSALMFLGVFQRRIVFYLILLPLLLTLLIGIFWNLNLGS